MNDELAKVRDWMQGQLDAEHEPPWATYRYMQAVALIDAMIAPRPPAAARRAGNVVYLDAVRIPR